MLPKCNKAYPSFLGKKSPESGDDLKLSTAKGISFFYYIYLIAFLFLLTQMVLYTLGTTML